jgi:hypothetical protein
MDSDNWNESLKRLCEEEGVLIEDFGEVKEYEIDINGIKVIVFIRDEI